MSEVKNIIEEIHSLHEDAINNLNSITTGNLSHKICFVKYFVSKIGEECDRLKQICDRFVIEEQRLPQMPNIPISKIKSSYIKK